MLKRAVIGTTIVTWFRNVPETRRLVLSVRVQVVTLTDNSKNGVIPYRPTIANAKSLDVRFGISSVRSKSSSVTAIVILLYCCMSWPNSANMPAATQNELPGRP